MRLILYIGIIALLIGCNTDSSLTQTTQEGREKVLFCDAEDLLTNHTGIYFNGDMAIFENGETRSSEQHHSGAYSCKLDSTHQFGMTTMIRDLEPGAYLQIDVWKLGHHELGYIVVSDTTGRYYETGAWEAHTDSSGWRHMFLGVHIPDSISTVKVYLMNPHSVPVYFDDLTIRVLPQQALAEGLQDQMSIQIDPKDYRKITKWVEKSRTLGIIKDKYKKYVDATVSYQGIVYPAEVRLKGDWADHLTGKKWSWRVKLKNGNVINGMNSFSLQSPHTRALLREWIAHAVFRREDILTTRYGFTQLTLNDENLGLYAVEEHFSKHLVEAMNRREGPILKYDESAVWELNLALVGQTAWIHVPILESASITPFKKKRTLREPALAGMFVDGAHLMRSLQTFSPKADVTYDVRKLAMAYALCDLLGVHHGLIWHNQRWYYNPVTARLEPVIFDCFVEIGVADHREDALLEGPIAGKHFEHGVIYQHFKDPLFRDHYEQYLKSFSSEAYVQELEALLSPQLDSLNPMFKAEYPIYEGSLQFLKDRAKRLRALTPQLDTIAAPEVLTERPRFSATYVTDSSLLFPAASIKAHLENEESHNSEIVLRNYHLTDVTLVGYGKKGNKGYVELSEPIRLAAFSPEDVAHRSVTIPTGYNRLIFMADNTGDELHRVKIHAWPSPEGAGAYEQYVASSAPLHRVFKSSEDGRTLVPRQEHWIVRQNIFIPAGHVVEIPAGQYIDLINNASIVSESPIHMNGDTTGIVIQSTDSSGQGIHVLKSADTIRWQNVTVSGLNTLSFQGWKLTGSITFHEAPVRMENVSIHHNLAEDGLNIIRSWVDLEEIHVSHTFSDGIDIDFGHGRVSSCRFEYTGNDGLDVSGTELVVDLCTFHHCGDKGLSAGEQSIVETKHCHVNGCVIGMASKDKSLLNVFSALVKNCQTAFHAYQKKPEFGPARLFLYGPEIENCDVPLATDKASEIRVDNEPAKVVITAAPI